MYTGWLLFSMFTGKTHSLDSMGFCPHPSHSDFSHVPEDKWSPTPQADGIYKLPKSSPHQLPRVKTWNTFWNTTWKCSGSCSEHSLTSAQQWAAPPSQLAGCSDQFSQGEGDLYSLAQSQSWKSRPGTLCRQKLVMQSDRGRECNSDTRILRCFNLKPLFCCKGERWLEQRGAVTSATAPPFPIPR